MKLWQHPRKGLHILQSTCNQSSLLSQFPKLLAWYSQQQAKPPTIQNLPEFHLWIVAKSLRAPEHSRCRLWSEGIAEIVGTCSSILESILETDRMTNELGASLSDIYSKLAESAIRLGEGQKAFKALQTLADKTELAAFRFLSAWTAFNIDQLPTCIAECEKVSDPFGPIHTLLGQAYLESGKVGDAIDALKVAVKMSPGNPLPLVQLVKAYLVTDMQIEACRTIDQCRKIVGLNIEVECLAAMSVMAGSSRTDDFCDRTLGAFETFLILQPWDFEAYSLALELAADLNKKLWAEKYTQIVDLSEIAQPLQLAKKVAALLKKTGDRQWHDISRKIIDKTLDLTKNFQTAKN
jgi:tetratricopeptide (TPR) repeat protein